jgi:hypothetical protein
MEYAPFAPKDLNVLTQLKALSNVPSSMNIRIKRVKLNAWYALLGFRAQLLLETLSNVWKVHILKKALVPAQPVRKVTNVQIHFKLQFLAPLPQSIRSKKVKLNACLALQDSNALRLN